jgi:hypothetical protein
MSNRKEKDPYCATHYDCKTEIVRFTVDSDEERTYEVAADGNILCPADEVIF